MVCVIAGVWFGGDGWREGGRECLLWRWRHVTASWTGGFESS